MSLRSSPSLLADREISWLGFSDRVLQEAGNPSVPLLERLRFCAIFSSNLDEYFRVRVASLRTLLRMGKGSPRLLHDIHRIVLDQQERYGALLRDILSALESEGIRLLRPEALDEERRAYVGDYFRRTVADLLEPVFLEPERGSPFLENQGLYLVVEVWPEHGECASTWQPEYAIVPVPSPPLGRFLVLPGSGHQVIFLDDVVRIGLPEVFPDHEVGRAYAIKLTRDAELHLDDEFEGSLVEAIRSSLARRDTGVPSRFLYDMTTPYPLVAALQRCLALEEEDLVLGGRYHNLHDFMTFPDFGRTDLMYPDWPALPHPALERAPSVLSGIRERDRIVHFPYQSFHHVLRFLREAAMDAAVTSIRLTVYRVARDSEVLKALLTAAQRGKRVTVFVEVQARFDEATNLEWATRLEDAGVTVLYSMPGLKVHAKLALVERTEDGRRRLYAYLATGNLNEKTSRIYADHGLLTADERITRDVERVFDFLAGRGERPQVEHLLVAPFNLREGFYRLIDAEAANARAGRRSGITLKMNALEDPDIIERLHRASNDGVPIDIIVRGICRLIPGLPGQSENIRARSIVDRYLEHGRIYLFHAGGSERMYVASADWMTRNLSRRVEVAFPVYDAEVKRQLRALLDVQLADNVRARIIDGDFANRYVPPSADGPVRAQSAYRDYLASCCR